MSNTVNVLLEGLIELSERLYRETGRHVLSEVQVDKQTLLDIRDHLDSIRASTRCLNQRKELTHIGIYSASGLIQISEALNE